MLFEGEDPSTYYAFGHPVFPKSPNVEVVHYSDTTGWNFYPWAEYKCTSIARPIVPEVQETTEGISIQIDTTSWPRYNKPRVIVCAVYDEYGKMLGLDMVDVTNSVQQLSVTCDTSAIFNGKLFLLYDSSTLAPIVSPVQFMD